MTSRTRYRTLQLIHRRVRVFAESYDLALALDDLDHIEPLFLTAAQRQQDARQGLPGAQAYDAPAVAGSGAERLTQPERLAAHPDRTSADRALLDRLLHDLELATRPGDVILDSAEWSRLVTRDCLTLRRLVDAWTPHEPSARDQRDVAVENDGAWCEHHRTARLDEPAEHYGTVSGNLSLPMHLCGYCYWQVRRKGRLPPGEAMVKRHRTGKDEKEKVG